MKKQIKNFMLVIGIMASLSACEKKEPTSLTDENIAGKATVEGYISYKSSSSTVTYAANVPVYVDISLNSFGYEGVKRYTATTNDKGFYQISIPTPPGKSISFSLSTYFIANYNTGTTTKKAIFSKSQSSGSATDGETVLRNIKEIYNSGFPEDQTSN